jgi:hypothetical protein
MKRSKNWRLQYKELGGGMRPSKVKKPESSISFLLSNKAKKYSALKKVK